MPTSTVTIAGSSRPVEIDPFVLQFLQQLSGQMGQMQQDIRFLLTKGVQPGKSQLPPGQTHFPPIQNYHLPGQNHCHPPFQNQPIPGQTQHLPVQDIIDTNTHHNAAASTLPMTMPALPPGPVHPTHHTTSLPLQPVSVHHLPAASEPIIHLRPPVPASWTPEQKKQHLITQVQKTGSAITKSKKGKQHFCLTCDAVIPKKTGRPLKYCTACRPPRPLRRIIPKTSSSERLSSEPEPMSLDQAEVGSQRSSSPEAESVYDTCPPPYTMAGDVSDPEGPDDDM